MHKKHNITVVIFNTKMERETVQYVIIQPHSLSWYSIINNRLNNF